MKFNSTLDKIKIYDSRFELSLSLDRNAIRVRSFLISSDISSEEFVSLGKTLLEIFVSRGGEKEIESALFRDGGGGKGGGNCRRMRAIFDG